MIMLDKYVYNYFVFIWMVFGFIIHIYDWVLIINNNEFSSFNARDKFKLIVPTIIIILYIISFCKHRFFEKNNQAQ